MVEESEESTPGVDDRGDSWSFADLHSRLASDAAAGDGASADVGDEPSTGDEPATLADLAGVVREQRALSEWRWVSIRMSGESQDTEPDTDSVWGQLEPTSSALLLGQFDGSTANRACCTLLEPAACDRTNRILVTNDRTMEDRLHATGGVHSGETLVIGIGDGSRSTSATPAVDGDGVATVSLPDPRNVARLGMHVSRQLTEWADDDADVVVCFHSLTGLLQTVDLDTLFRFLHVMDGRIRAAGAYAHYHVDPAAHDEETLATLRPIFDAVLTYDERGAIIVED